MTRPWVSALDVGVTPGNPGEPEYFL